MMLAGKGNRRKRAGDYFWLTPSNRGIACAGSPTLSALSPKLQFAHDGVCRRQCGAPPGLRPPRRLATMRRSITATGLPNSDLLENRFASPGNVSATAELDTSPSCPFPCVRQCGSGTSRFRLYREPCRRSRIAPAESKRCRCGACRP